MAKKKRPRRPQCEPCGKRSYPSEEDAVRTILWRVRRMDGRGLRYYRCPHGNGYHLTKKPHRFW